MASIAGASGDDLFRVLAETAPDAILVMDERSVILSANPAVERIFGYAPEELIGESLARLIPARMRGAHDQGVRRYLDTGERKISWEGIRLPGVHKSGREIELEISFGEFQRDGNRIFAGFVRDVTDRVEQQRHLEETAAELETSIAELEEARSAAESANERLQAVQQVTDAALAPLGLDDLLDALLTRVREVLRADTATILLCSDDGDYLVVQASQGLEEEENMVVPVGQGIAGRIALQRRAVIMEDITGLETISPALRRLRSLMGLPLIVHGRLTGVLHVGTFERRLFTEEELQLLRTVADRIASAVDRARLHDAAQESGRAKADFLAVISHELRTPLSAIIGYTDLLLEEISGPVTTGQREQLSRIRTSSRHLQQLIEEVLAFSRMESGRTEVHLEEVSLPELVREMEEVVEPLAQEKGLELSLACEEAASIQSDVPKLRQILLNLLSNAIKFTEEGEVALTARVEGAEAVFRVRDTGIGIGREHLERIWEPFWQVQQTMTRTAGGTGLGLSIVRKLARLLGGDVEVESAPGEGTCFTVRVPTHHPG